MYITYIKKQRKVTLYDDDDNIIFETFLNISMKNKFDTICKPYINDMFKHMSKKEKEIFKNALLDFFNSYNITHVYKLINVSISAAKKYLDNYIKEHNFSWVKANKKHVVSFNEEENYKLTIYTLVLKLMSIIIFNEERDNYNYNKIVRIIIEKTLPTELMNKIVEFVRYNIIQSASSREHLWMFLELTAKITPELYLLDTINFLFVHMFTFMKITPKIFSYIAAYVNQSNYFLYTDVYTKEEKQSDIIRVKFMNNFDILEKNVVNITFDTVIKPYSKHIFDLQVEPRKKMLNNNYPTFLRQFKVKPFDLIQKTKYPNQVTKYISIPVMLKLFDTKHYYLIQYKDFKYIEFYTSIVLEKYLGLVYIAKLMRSTPISKTNPETIKKLKVLKRYIESFNDIKSQQRNMLASRLYLTNVMNSIKESVYYDPVYNDVFIVNLDHLVNDFVELYTKYFNGDLDNLFEKIRENKFILEDVYDVQI